MAPEPYTTSTDVTALRATIAMLLEELAQARRDADGWYTRTLAAEQRERVAQAQMAAMREARPDDTELLARCLDCLELADVCAPLIEDVRGRLR